MRGIERPAGRITASVIAALCALLLLAPGAGAAPPWAAPVPLAPTGPTSLGATSTAVARDGTRYVAFTRSDGTNPLVTVARAAPGGGYEAGVTLSAPGAGAFAPQVVVDRQGTATVAWLRGTAIQAATRPAGGTWGTPQTLGTGVSGARPAVAAGDNGAAVVAWSALDGAQSRVAVAVRPAGAAAFDASTFVSAAAGSIYAYPRAAMDAAGDVAVLWQRYYEVTPGTSRYVMEDALKPATSGFAAPETRSFTGGAPGSGAVSSDFNVVMTSAGRTLASWDYYDGSVIAVQYAERVPGSTFGTPTSWSSVKALSDAGASASAPKIAVNDAGAAVAVWSSGNVIQSAVRATADGAFSAQKPLSGAGASTGSSVVALAPNGEAEVAWTVFSGNDRAILASRRAPGSAAFGDPVDVVRETVAAPVTGIGFAGLSVGLDDQGNGALAWQRSVTDGSGTTYAPLAASVDPVAPELTGVTVPASATVGTAAAFAASATDRVSTPAIAWSFGDGGTATGGGPSHVFGAPGAYTVTVTATDAQGNATTTTRPILVTAAAGGGGGGGAGGGGSTPDVDADGDGVVARLDCNDKNAAVHPGAKEIRGNAVDEDCSGKADKLLPIAATAKLSAKRRSGGRTRTTTLTVSGLKKGDVVSLACRGGGCRKAATTRRTIKKGTSLSLTSAVRGMVLRSGATLTVKVTRKGFSTRVVTFRTARKAAPARTLRCQDPGASATRTC